MVQSSYQALQVFMEEQTHNARALRRELSTCHESGTATPCINFLRKNTRHACYTDRKTRYRDSDFLTAKTHVPQL